MPSATSQLNIVTLRIIVFTLNFLHTIGVVLPNIKWVEILWWICAHFLLHYMYDVWETISFFFKPETFSWSNVTLIPWPTK